jgi:endonuclease/exonuclease/phosphatase family metal-dependent hydrolase
MDTWCVALGLFGVRLLGFFSEPLLDEHDIHRVIGHPARFDAAAAPADPTTRDLKIVTWNIERGTAYESILRAIRDVDPDVALLQEVDWDCRRTGYRHVARDLADALQMNWVAAGEFQEIGEGGARPAMTGQAILSRLPIHDASTLRFAAQDRWRWSVNPVQPRRGGRIALKAIVGGITIYNTHIESGTNRSLQRRQIVEILADDTKDAHDGPVVIGGDFNNGPIVHAPMFGSLNAAAFADALVDVGKRVPTSLGQSDPIDWLFVKNMKPAQGRVLDRVKASDHFPVTALLGFTPGPLRR